MTRATLYLLHYNNYYNRLVKQEISLQRYIDYIVGEPLPNINFIPNDFINTEQIINWNYQEDPDYLVVVDEYGEINSRWFIVSTTRTRAGQLRLELHRDLVVDYYNVIVEAPCFIEKATPKSIRDPAIYHSENMSFNEIKEREQLLYDETKCPWIVGYIPRDSFKESTTINLSAQLSGTAYKEYDDIGEFPFYKYKNQIVSGQVTNPTIKIGVTYWLQRISQAYYFKNDIKIDQQGNYIGLDSYRISKLDGYYWMQSSDSPVGPNVNKFTDQYARTVVSKMPQLKDEFKNLSIFVETSDISPSEYQDLLKYDGKLIYEKSTGKYYKVTLEGNQTTQGSTPITWISSLGENMSNTIVKEFDGHQLQDPINPQTYSPFSFTSDTPYQTLKIEPQEVQVSVTVPSTRYQASGSPYDIFCMPYSDSLKIYKNGAVYIDNPSKSVALTIAQQIMTQVGQNSIYDVQLLPYCPVRYCIEDDGSFDIGSAIYSDVLAGGEKSSVLLWATSDSIKFDIPVSIPELQTVLDKKVANETQFVRLVSPNFGNFFNFKPQMNEGLDKISVVCQFKPFNPYIKLQPNFKGMYGNNFNDARGLICNGDFSLAQITSAWADYELQNKNYHNIFVRGTENINVTNKYQRIQEGFSAGTGALTGIGAGALAGSMFGPVGTAIGATVGGIASIGGGIGDLVINEKLRSEALDYREDLYHYNLQNIQALPYGLAKTSAISPDNKLVPFIEFYTCTTQEKQALENKLKYNGYTIMMIDTIANYIRDERSYIKGKLIRLEDIDEDYHVINAIADELFKGVFI